MHFNTFKKITQKTGGRVFAIGDVHGCLETLKQLLREIAFDEDCDRAVFVGDLADRGPQNLETIQFVLNKPCFYLVAGNHEDLLVEYVTQSTEIPEEELAYWLADDGAWTRGVMEKTLAEVVQQLQAQAYYIVEVEVNQGVRFGVTHAGYFEEHWYQPHQPYDDVYFRRLAWVRRSAESAPGELAPTAGIDFTVHGHTIFRQPWRNGNALFIDTGCFAGGKLTALDLGAFAQSRQFDRGCLSAVSRIP